MALSIEENEMYTRVGPGTPGGDMHAVIGIPSGFPRN
jgi:hypothetical protein